MTKICVLRVQTYPHSDYKYMKCLVSFDCNYIDGFYFFGTRSDWLQILTQLEEKFPDTIFKTKFEEV